MSRIVITGMGVISSIGISVAVNRQSLVNGVSGISPLELFPSRFSGRLPCGEIKIATEELTHLLSITDPSVTRTSLLGLHAFREAIAEAQITDEELRSFDTALIGASTVGGMCLTDELHRDANARDKGSAFLASYDCASLVTWLQSYFNMKGPSNTINTACSSSANAILYGARLIRNGRVKRAIVGGADSLAKFTINGFNALRIFSPDHCTPFDKNRKGLNLGEGASFLVLEREEDVPSKKILAVFSGGANTNDAFHPSSLSENGDGPFLSMAGALNDASISAGEIDCINAHGTGTENNDEVESRAMIRIFDKPPSFISTKANTGHTLGAAGALEAVFCIFHLQYDELYPAIAFKDPIESTELIPEMSYTQRKIRHVMSNSFGFGGNCTSLVFSKS